MADVERVVEVEGVVSFMRSEEGPHDCLCCDGPHIFGRGIDVEPEPGRATTRKHYSDWISDALLDNRLEGRPFASS